MCIILHWNIREKTCSYSQSIYYIAILHDHRLIRARQNFKYDDDHTFDNCVTADGVTEKTESKTRCHTPRSIV